MLPALSVPGAVDHPAVRAEVTRRRADRRHDRRDDTDRRVREVDFGRVHDTVQHPRPRRAVDAAAQGA